MQLNERLSMFSKIFLNWLCYNDFKCIRTLELLPYCPLDTYFSNWVKQFWTGPSCRGSWGEMETQEIYLFGDISVNVNCCCFETNQKWFFSTIQFLCHVQYTEKFSISQYLTLWSLVSQQLMDRFAKLNKQTCCKFSDLYNKNVFKECPSRIIFQKGQKLEKNHKKNVWMPVTRKRWVVPKLLKSTFWLQI